MPRSDFLLVRTVFYTHRLYVRVLQNGVDDLFAGYKSAGLTEVMSRPSHLRHGGEAELVEVLQDLMVEVR